MIEEFFDIYQKQVDGENALHCEALRPYMRFLRFPPYFTDEHEKDVMIEDHHNIREPSQEQKVLLMELMEETAQKFDQHLESR